MFNGCVYCYGIFYVVGVNVYNSQCKGNLYMYQNNDCVEE